MNGRWGAENNMCGSVVLHPVTRHFTEQRKRVVPEKAYGIRKDVLSTGSSEHFGALMGVTEQRAWARMPLE